MYAFIHPETGKEFRSNKNFFAFAVFSDIETQENPRRFMILKCQHRDYDLCKKEFDYEVEEQKKCDQNESRSVSMIYRTDIGLQMEGLVINKYDNY